MIIAYTALHYGSPYLEWAIRSVIDHVDEYYIFYSADGSHGTRSNAILPNSDTPQALKDLAFKAAGDKLQWIEGGWQHEGQQRDAIYDYMPPNTDAILVLDYDEIWQDVDKAIKYAIDYNVQRSRLPMVHFWRSFHRAIIHDPAYPIRIIVPGGTQDHTIQVRPIAHMGYAIPSWLVRYKMAIHGHKAELRKDIDWFRDRWITNAEEDCHPVGSEFWNPEIVRPGDYLPAFMQDHPYAQMRVIP
jgi:hypothetical protein